MKPNLDLSLLSFLIHGIVLGHLSGLGQSIPNTYEQYRGLSDGDQQSENQYDMYRGNSARSPYRLVNKVSSVDDSRKKPAHRSRPASPVGSRSEELDLVTDVQLAEVYSHQNTTVERVKKTKKRINSKVKETYGVQPKRKVSIHTEGGEDEEPAGTEETKAEQFPNSTVPIRLVSSNGRLIMKMNATIVATAFLESALEL